MTAATASKSSSPLHVIITTVEFTEGFHERVRASRRSLETTIASGVGVYGVNTGLGDNVRYRISEDEMVQLQENILRSHGCAVGRILTEEEARAS